jgi:hypothetical protein
MGAYAAVATVNQSASTAHLLLYCPLPLLAGGAVASTILFAGYLYIFVTGKSKQQFDLDVRSLSGSFSLLTLDRIQ